MLSPNLRHFATHDNTTYETISNSSPKVQVLIYTYTELYQQNKYTSNIGGNPRELFAKSNKPDPPLL